MSMDGIPTGSGSLSRLRDVFRRQRRDSDPSSADQPEIDFEYSDTDSLFNELSELYTYSEIPELHAIKSTFEKTLQARCSTSNWINLPLVSQKAFIFYLLDKLEVVDLQDRLGAVRSLLYLAHGNYCYGIDEADIGQCSRANVMLMLRVGVYPALVELLALEKENGRGGFGAGYEGMVKSGTSLTIADNVTLRAAMSLLYVLIETIRREDPLDTPSEAELRRTFLRGLGNPIYGDDNLTAFLFRMLLNFCNGSMPHYPVRKILLLIWKTILASLGGTEKLTSLKQEARERCGLNPVFCEDKPPRPFVFPTATYDPRGSAAPIQHESMLPGLLSRPVSIISDIENLIDFGSQKGLDFRPKARQKDVETFIEACQSKFGCYGGGPNSAHSDDSANSTAGLPDPIIESIKVLKEHVYVSLSEVQIHQEEELAKKRAGNSTEPLPTRDTPTEFLYKSLLPNLPQYMIAVLKVLLAAAPSKTTKESLNIFVDVIPPDGPANMMESAQNSIDINRHKEIIVKAVSATLLLLLKHFKVNHVYQFEYMSQHLVFANCIPLVLKFLNQNITQYVSARNNFPMLNFPGCVLVPDTSSRPTDIAEGMTTDGGYCWRNVFSCINLIRILEKLTKWKHSRTVMLVVFKSAPILKRALKVRNSMMQLYILKLLKAQTKYLGRNWRKSNMKIISAIYRRVRHHLHDDWAYGNDMDAKPWDFQTEEFALKNSVEKFNSMYYEMVQHPQNPFGSDLPPIDSHYLSVLSEPVELSQAWKENYEEWMEVEIFQHPIDWDTLTKAPFAHIDTKPIEF